ncbi:MAG TPA: CopD family protein [Kiloniellales bacterium]|nr:CopD family protein [Kiloniellales bacterium]
MSFLLSLHALAAVIWVGGMFFAYVILRPAAGPLETPQRLLLWRGVFTRFFPWVWASILLLLVTGYAMVFGFLGGFAGAAVHVHVMQALGLAMMLIFAHLFFAPWRRFRGAVDSEDYPTAGKELGGIRRIVGINLLLGLLVVVIGSGGRYW